MKRSTYSLFHDQAEKIGWFALYSFIGLLVVECSSTSKHRDFDLVCSPAAVIPNPAIEGEAMWLQFSVVNAGRDDVPPAAYGTYLYVDDHPAAFDKSDMDFPTGRKLHHRVPLFGLRAGKHFYRLVVDPENILLETNEENNEIIGSFEVVAKPTN